ncbi:MAG: response regulator transcription factor [Pseudomonadota bacterium]
MTHKSEDPIRLVIADDHDVVRRGLRAFIDLASDIDLVATGSNGQEAVAAVQQHAPDVLLLDLFMPGQDVETTIRGAKSASPRTQIVILTSHEGNEHLSSVIRAGALSYILKDTSPEALLSVIRSARNGEATITPRIAKTLLDHPKPIREDGLTEREIEVLKAIASGLSNKQIAADLDITERTVKSHVSNILAKLYLSDRTQAAIYAWREGVVRGGKSI